MEEKKINYKILKERSRVSEEGKEGKERRQHRVWEAVSEEKIKKRSDGIKRECEVSKERERERERERNQDRTEPRYIYL